MIKIFAKFFISLAVALLVGMLGGNLNRNIKYYEIKDGRLKETINKWEKADVSSNHTYDGYGSGADINKTTYKRNIEKSFFNYELAAICSIITLCVLIIILMTPYLIKREPIK